MDENQSYLENLGVSLLQLQKLIEAARLAGALGAKLTGGGQGGCILTLIEAGKREKIEKALKEAGATETFFFEIGPEHA